MNQPLYGVWLGDVFFCFPVRFRNRVDAWSRVVRTFRRPDGIRPFANASLRLAELRYPAKVLGSKAHGVGTEDTWRTDDGRACSDTGRRISIANLAGS